MGQTTLTVDDEVAQRFKDAKPYRSIDHNEWLVALLDEWELQEETGRKHGGREPCELCGRMQPLPFEDGTVCIDCMKEERPDLYDKLESRMGELVREQG